MSYRGWRQASGTGRWTALRRSSGGHVCLTVHRGTESISVGMSWLRVEGRRATIFMSGFALCASDPRMTRIYTSREDRRRTALNRNSGTWQATSALLDSMLVVGADRGLAPD